FALPFFQLTAQPDYIDFGSMVAGESVTKQVTIKNLSESSEALITTIKLKSGTEGFEVLGFTGNILLLPGKDTTIDIKFTAVMDGAFGDSLGIGDTCVTIYKSLMHADVGSPEIIVSDINFGDLTSGYSAAQQLTVKNIVKSDLHITGCAEPTIAAFKAILPPEIKAATPANPYTLKASDPPLVINVEFNPPAEGQYSDFILISSNARKSDSIGYLNARGISPGLVANSCEFGRCRINRVEFPAGPYLPLDNTEGFTVENSGVASLTITGLQIIKNMNGDAFKFNIDTLNNLVLAPSQKIIVPVQFLPSTVGEYELVIRYLNSDNSKTETRMHGIGVAPVLSVSNLNFDTTIVNDERKTSEKKLRITNLGADVWLYADTLRIFDIIPMLNGSVSPDWEEFGTEGFKINKASKLPGVILPGETLDIDAAFKANKTGNSEASMMTRSDALKDTTFMLSGAGIEQGIIVRGGSAEVCIGESDTIFCSVENFGSNSVHIDSLKLEPAQFNLSFTDASLMNGFDIEPNHKQIVTILFSPTSNIGVSSELIAISKSEGLTSTASVSGKAILAERTISINPPYQKAVIGQLIECNITLENGDDISCARLSKLRIRVTSSNQAVQLIPDSIETGSLLNGKFLLENIKKEKGDSSVSFELNSINGALLSGFGDLASLKLKALLPSGASDISDISVEVTPVGTACINMTASDAKIVIKPTCAMQLRKIQGSDYQYGLHEISPNPVKNSGGNIVFSIGLEAYTELVIYNSESLYNQTIVSKDLPAGKYTIDIPIDKLTSGTYFCRLTSGPYQETKKFVITK
ncbi:MAG: hypothetical protein QG635_2001, partial [Bacteroidota bacterium]|nr:hypothetical protein [Bacteroidota bacterium]